MSDQYTEDGRAADAGADKEERAIIERARQAITLPIEALRIGMRVRVINPDYAQEHEGIVYEIIGLTLDRLPPRENVTVRQEGTTGGGEDGWEAKNLELIDGDAFTLLVLSLQAQINQAGKDRHALAAAQATIAELTKERDDWKVIDGKWRIENAALRAQESHSLSRCTELKNETLEVGRERDALRADRDGLKDARTREDNNQRIVAAQLATAIAERDKANSERSRYRADLEKTFASTDRIDKERMAALAACAAKDAALKEAKDFLCLYSCPTRETLEVVAAALSPNAGSDYVPKAILKIQDDLLHVIMGCYPLLGGHRNLIKEAHAIAAPYLTTDSTGEEKV